MRINDTLSIGEEQIEESFIRSSGPGGQNVNKSATAVQLRFNVHACGALALEVKGRLLGLAGTRATLDGCIVITAREYRSQEQNRAEARDRLRDLILRALTRPKRRRKTKPTRSSVERRISSKKRRARMKSDRGKSW